MFPLWWGGRMVNICWKQFWGYGNQPPEQWIHLPPSYPLSQSLNTILQPGYFLPWLMAESWVEVNSGESVASPQKQREQELIWRISVEVVQCIFKWISRLAGISPDNSSSYPSGCCTLCWVISYLSLASPAPKWDTRGAFAWFSTDFPLSVTPAPSSRAGCVFQPRSAHGGATDRLESILERWVILN